MPNHIKNKMLVVGDPVIVSALMEFIKCTDEGCKSRIDFDNIIRMPESMQGDSLTDAVEAAKYVYNPFDSRAQWWWRTAAERGRYPGKMDDGTWAQFIECLHNLRKFGYAYWRDWAIDKWGTKWNAYDTPDSRDTADTIFFETAWSSPLPVFQRLSEIYPDVVIHVEYADEDLGFNCGRATFGGGDMNHEKMLPGEDAKQFAISLHYPDGYEEEEE